jgi:hypothetical protein
MSTFWPPPFWSGEFAGWFWFYTNCQLLVHCSEECQNTYTTEEFSQQGKIAEVPGE